MIEKRSFSRTIKQARRHIRTMGSFLALAYVWKIFRIYIRIKSFQWLWFTEGEPGRTEMKINVNRIWSYPNCMFIQTTFGNDYWNEWSTMEHRNQQSNQIIQMLWYLPRNCVIKKLVQLYGFMIETMALIPFCLRMKSFYLKVNFSN